MAIRIGALTSPVLLALVLAGCETVEVWQYPNITLNGRAGLTRVRATENVVRRACSNERVRCCFDTATNTEWIAWGQEDCIFHEDCHANGELTENLDCMMKLRLTRLSESSILDAVDAARLSKEAGLSPAQSPIASLRGGR
jgi:hypothetical protein